MISSKYKPSSPPIVKDYLIKHSQVSIGDEEVEDETEILIYKEVERLDENNYVNLMSYIITYFKYKLVHTQTSLQKPVGEEGL